MASLSLIFNDQQLNQATRYKFWVTICVFLSQENSHFSTSIVSEVLTPVGEGDEHKQAD